MKNRVVLRTIQAKGWQYGGYTTYDVDCTGISATYLGEKGEVVKCDTLWEDVLAIAPNPNSNKTMGMTESIRISVGMV